MPAYLIPALTTAFSSAMQFWARKKPKPFRSTAEGKYLQEVGREGAISSQTQGIIAGRVGRDAGNVAGQRVSRLRGFLQARGMGGSIAGARLLDQPLQDYQRTVADTRENVTLQNEQTKTNAKMQFAQKSNQYDEVRRQDQNQAIQQFAGGLSSAAQQGFDGYAREKQLDYMSQYYGGRGKGPALPPGFASFTEEDVYRWATENKIDPEEAIGMWYEIRP